MCSQEITTDLWTQGPWEAPIDSPAASGIGEGTNAENASYVFPLKMFAYNSTTHTPQEVSPSHLQKNPSPTMWLGPCDFQPLLILQKCSGMEKADLQGTRHTLDSAGWVAINSSKWFSYQCCRVSNHGNSNMRHAWGQRMSPQLRPHSKAQLEGGCRIQGTWRKPWYLPCCGRVEWTCLRTAPESLSENILFQL